MQTIKSIVGFIRTNFNKRCRPSVYAKEIYTACEQGDLKKVQEGFESVDRNKLLSIAVSKSDRRLVEFMLKPMISVEHAILVSRKRPSISEYFEFEKRILNSCLKQAVEKNIAEVTELLLRAGADAVVGIRIAKAGTILNILCKYDKQYSNINGH